MNPTTTSAPRMGNDAHNSHAALVAALEQAQAALRTLAVRMDSREIDLVTYAHEQATLAYNALAAARNG